MKSRSGLSPWSMQALWPTIVCWRSGEKRRASVFVDGVVCPRVRTCFTGKNGWAEYLEVDSTGKLLVVNGSPVVKRVKGEVRVEFHDQWAIRRMVDNAGPEFGQPE